LRDLQSRNFDLAIQMHGAGPHVNEFISLIGAGRVTGFYQEGEWCPDDETFLLYPAELPEIWRHLRLMQTMQIPLAGDHLHFQVEESWRSSVSRYRGLGRPYVVIHPGAKTAAFWSEENFAAVGDELASRGFQVFLTGMLEESALTRQIARQMEYSAIDISGQTSIGELAALIESASLVVCHDTGVSHISAALRTPSVVIFKGADTQGWPPLNRQLHRFVWSLGDIAPARVLAEADDLLTRQFLLSAEAGNF
jgi:ADP-heptose:LPS heptosyltransferase